MRSIVHVLSLVAAGMLVQGCISSDSQIGSYSPPNPQTWAAARSLNFVNLGHPGAGQIAVTVYGEVKTPGIFMLTEGVFVKDALAAAGGLTDFVKWGRSGITRANGSSVRFDPRHRAADEGLRLHNGDSLYVSLITE